MASESPKLFISYSWSTSAHEEWVISLATELRENGVDVILDKWDLKEGQDGNVFMEKMVNDPEIKKVAMICDSIYAEKADGRSGGVGTETQIISPEVYTKQDQTKFVAVLPERDANGEPFLPTFYKNRIFIDLSNPELYGRNFEQLLRWIFDKPQYEKPELGEKPMFLDEKQGISLQTTTKYRRALEAIRDSRPYWQGALFEYFETFTTNLERFRISHNDSDTEEFDDKVLKNIEQFLPYRNEAIKIFKALARYQSSQESGDMLHRFFEGLIPYLSRPEEVRHWKEWDFDNFKFIIHELFLYAVAALVQSERFDIASKLLTQQYYVGDKSDYSSKSMVPFFVFRSYVKSLDYRNGRLELNRISLHADLIKERSSTSEFAFEQVMQADFILYIRSCNDNLPDTSRYYDYWWPETWVYTTRKYGAFEVFARSQSKHHFDKFKIVFGIEGKEELTGIIKAMGEGKLQIPRKSFHSMNPSTLMGHEEIATLA